MKKDMKIAAGFQIAALVAVALFGVAIAQSSCDCELEVGATCIVHEWTVGKFSGCVATPYACNRCVCVTDGSMSCSLKTGSALDATCNLVTTTYAECPSEIPEPTGP
mmetsp:Transcript_16784/g.36461  ORF Transcript_16784/g.36461 Transcript_16784/m.36461 type:complete len:107 (-) Transcript_16784:412-732(-)